jgi:serine/threonine protein kinase
MKLPEGMTLGPVLSPGPLVFVAHARRGDQACIVKCAASARAWPLVETETRVLEALARVDGVPRILETWEGGLALEVIPFPTLHSSRAALRADAAFRQRAVRAAFRRLASIHDARDADGVPLDVVHGDVSPDNVYVSPSGEEIVLGDFGLARGRRLAAAPAEGAFFGTLRYAAPEVARGERADARADDFALAASLLETATGITLHEEKPSAAALVEAGTVPLGPAHPWRNLAQSLFDPPLAAHLIGCLAFDRRNRPRAPPPAC